MWFARTATESELICFAIIGWLQRLRSTNGKPNDPTGAAVNRMQSQVESFHAKFNQRVLADSAIPGIHRPLLRVALIEEESKETCDAIEAGDLIGAIDGLCDLIYVALGTAIEFGIDLEPFFDEVHRSNMAKVVGSMRADGKILKPDGWMPPDIAGILERGGE